MLDQIKLQLEGRRIKEREDSERGGDGGRLFEGDGYFKYFRQREAIIRGKQLIKGRLLFEEIGYNSKKKKKKLASEIRSI